MALNLRNFVFIDATLKVESQLFFKQTRSQCSLFNSGPLSNASFPRISSNHPYRLNNPSNYVLRNNLVKVFSNFGSKGGSEEEDEIKRDNSENSDESIAFKERMERLMGKEDEFFRGKDLALLIRKKYGRSYDVQFIKKEFMGKQYLAMNVMWKYREQKSFPLTEEQYIHHLDGIADNLRCWGAVSTIKTSLEKTKERPRIGKAVSLFIDLDEAGGRADEWINR